MDQFLERLTHAVACTWWLANLLQTLTALVYTGTCASKQLCSGAVYGQQRITLLLGVSPCICPAKLYDTRLNMCVLVCMLDLLFCSTIADFTFTSWFLCRHTGEWRNLPFKHWVIWHQLLTVLTPHGKALSTQGQSFIFLSSETHSFY